MFPRETVSFVFSRVLMFLEIKSKETSGLEGKQSLLVSRGTIHKTAKTNKHTVVFGARASTTQLYPCRDTFEFDQGHVTEN